MSRTTATAVRGIAKIKRSIEDSDLDPFIEAANAIVTKVCLDSDYTDPELELIERWLSAHFYHVFDPRRNQERADVVSAFYEGKSGMGFDFTRYGQMAKRLDTAGNLAILDANCAAGRRPITPTLTWLGRTEEERGL